MAFLYTREGFLTEHAMQTAKRARLRRGRLSQASVCCLLIAFWSKMNMFYCQIEVSSYLGETNGNDLKTWGEIPALKPEAKLPCAWMGTRISLPGMVIPSILLLLSPYTRQLPSRLTTYGLNWRPPSQKSQLL